jgi:hypothetical protein
MKKSISLADTPILYLIYKVFDQFQFLLCIASRFNYLRDSPYFWNGKLVTKMEHQSKVVFTVRGKKYLERMAKAGNEVESIKVTPMFRSAACHFDRNKRLHAFKPIFNSNNNPLNNLIEKQYINETENGQRFNPF